MPKTIDARGLSCPEPVILAKNAVDALTAGEEIIIMVDAEVAKENVSRYLRNAKKSAKIQEIDGYFKISVKG
ncbi:MAG: sulfurtransferase TusA family protein [Bacillota bacterium]